MKSNTTFTFPSYREFLNNSLNDFYEILFQKDNEIYKLYVVDNDNLELHLWNATQNKIELIKICTEKNYLDIINKMKNYL